MKTNQEQKRSFDRSIYFTRAKLIIGSLLLIAVICSGIASAQQQTFQCISYYRILPGKEHELSDLMETVEAKVQQERVNSGAISAWYLYEVLSPSGSNAEYDYVIMTITNRFKNLYETPYTFDSAFKKTFPGNDAKFYTDYYSRLTGVCRLVKEEIYAAVSLADSSSPGRFQSRYLVVDFMQPKPEKFGQYVKMETDTFRLIHKERIKLGAIDQWAFLQLVMPFDMKTGYSYLALNFHKDLDVMFDARYTEGVKKAFPTVDLNNLFQSAAAMRDNPRADLLRLVLFALPAKR